MYYKTKEECDKARERFYYSPVDKINLVCTCNDPLMMVIPDEGVTLHCPKHGYYFVRGQHEITLDVLLKESR